MLAGYGRAELTPPVGVELAGYGYYLGRKATHVVDPLYARAVLFDHAGERALVISCDVLGLRGDVVRDVLDDVERSLNCPQDHVLLVSVHTHTGPAIIHHEGCGEVDPAYVATVAGSIVKACRDALDDLAPVTALTTACREIDGDFVYNRADPDGPVDNLVRGFTLERAGKSPIALISFACHGVCRGRTSGISADFAGAVVRKMEEKGCQAVYLNGLCGDIDPRKPSPERMEAFADTIVRAFEQPQSPLPRTLAASRIPFTLSLTRVTAQDIHAAAAEAVRRAGGEDAPSARVARAWEKDMLARFDSLKTEQQISVAYLLLGGVPVLALPFEGFTQIGRIIRERVRRSNVPVLGCAEELFGYLPTRDDITRGAYAALESTFLYKRLPVVPGEAERLGEEVGGALERILYASA